MNAKDLIQRLKDNLDGEVLIHDAATGDDLSIGTVVGSYSGPIVLHIEGDDPS